MISLELQRKLSECLTIILNKAVLDSETIEELEEILRTDEVFNIRELIYLLVKRAPYLTEQQQGALMEDIDGVFDEIETADFLGEKIKEIQNRLSGGDFVFSTVEDNKEPAD